MNHTGTFLLTQDTITSYESEKNNSNCSIFIKSGSVLPQQKCSVMIFFLGEA